MAPFKLENVIILQPGSRHVNAMMGVGETPIPPRFKFPARMFPTDKTGEYEAVKIRVRKRVKTQEQANGAPNGVVKAEEEQPVDTEMGDSTNGAAPTITDLSQDINNATSNVTNHAVEEEEYLEEDPESDEGAVWPIVEGRIENFECFAALMTHVWQSLNPNFNSPVVIVAQPVWTLRDYENITKLVFQHWTIPCLHIADAASLAAYGVGLESALVVDVGYEKCDITPIHQHCIDHGARRSALKGCGGRTMTQNLVQLLKDQSFDENMAEQLKRSNVCEILPYGTPLPSSTATNGNVSNPAAAASTGATASGPNAKEENGGRPGQAPRGPGNGTEVEEDDNEGVMDIASIVARDNAAELLAKREAEKAAKAAARKGGAQEQAKQVRLKNSEKIKTTFTYKASAPGDSQANGNVSKREVEVGLERFKAAQALSPEFAGILDIIAWNIRNTIMACNELRARPVLWDNLLLVGNGSRIKGFRDALYALLINKYRLSPSTATIFTSELPSNFTTPVATPGTNTPIPGQGGHAMHHAAGHGVNPLLLAATRNMMQPGTGQHLQVPGHATPLPDMVSRENRPISQAPSSIKYAKLPEYLPDWKDAEWVNYEEASFAGAQTLAGLIFTSKDDSKWYLLRSEYNDEGPPGMAQYCLGWNG